MTFQLPFFAFQLVVSVLWQPNYWWLCLALFSVSQWLFRGHEFLQWLAALLLVTYWIAVSPMLGSALFIAATLQFYTQNAWPHFKVGRHPIRSMAIRISLLAVALVLGILFGFWLLDFSWTWPFSYSMILIMATSIFAVLFLRSLEYKKRSDKGE